MELQNVNSSYIKAAGFESKDGAFGTVEIMFSNGKRFYYQDVDKGDYTRLVNSSSIGKAFRQIFLPKYKGIPLQ